ncbi:MAG: hypothetical protein ACYC1L_09745, partial [Alphaproteobacteria bacterium]
KTPIICSSVNLERFIVWSFPKGPDSSSAWIKPQGQCQRSVDVARFMENRGETTKPDQVKIN